MRVIRRGRVALVGVLLAVTAGSASFGAVAMTSGHASIANSAVTLPTSLTNDPGATLGGVDFFNASGVEITTGSLSAPFAAFAVAQNAPATAQSPQKASLFAYTPVLGEAPGNWSGAQIHHVTSAYPVTSPADLAGLPSGTVVYTATTKDTSLSTYIGLFPNTDTSTTDGYSGIYTIRVTDVNGDYGKADISINTTAGTWTQEDGTFTPPASGSGPTGTSTTVTADPASPITAGTSVTFTASISPTSAAGSVQFMDGAAALGSAVTITNGTATFTTTSLPAGTHSITAVFTPSDATAFSASTSTAISYVVNAPGAASTTTAIASNPGGPVTMGTSVQFTATVTPSTAAGSVQFMDGSDTLGSPATVDSGVATFTTTNLSVATHSITAVFTASSPSAFASSTSLPLSFEVDAAAGSGPTTTITALTANPTSPTTAGTSVTFTASVTPSPAGSVQFMDGTQPLGSAVPVSGGTASSAPTTALSTGTHSITAVFTPTDATAFTGSTSDPLSYVVNAAGAAPTTTSTAVTASPASPTTAGTAVTFTATMTPSAAAGTVQFMDGAAALGSAVAVTNGTAVSAVTTTLSATTHSITAVFTPTNASLFGPSTSPAISYVVNAAGTPATTTTTLTSSVASPTTTGTSVTFTATLAPTSAVGTVQFMNGTTAMGSPVAVSASGTATYATAFGAAATYSITAVFTPTSATAYTASTSSAISFVVTGATVTTTALAVTPASTAAAGADVQLTATVTPSTAVGSVAFYDGSTTLGSQALASGSATLSTTTLAVGSTHSFVAIFTPTNSTATDPTAFFGSQSPAVAYTITAADTATATLTGPDGSTLSSDPTLTTGEVITVQAGGFTAGETVSAVVHSTPETLTPATASSTGTINYQFTVPNDLPAGAHTLVLTGATSQNVVTIDFSIASPAVLGTTTTSTPSAGSASLPFTGSDIELLAAIAIACTGVGLAMRTRKVAPRYVAGHEWRRRH